MSAITVEKLTKVYKIYNSPIDRLKESMNPFVKRYHHDFFALKDVSFKVEKGDTFGIIGKNGSGKSTLLKIITGILTPSSGTVDVNGRIASLLELGAGFNPERTGIENIYLNGTIMGYSKAEMDERLDDIMSFADIGEFINQPVKMYSSGMFVRLAFALSINVDPDILIIDEALSVGDGRFQLKCFERIKTLQKTGTTIIIVSHELQSIRQFCNKAALFDGGNLLEVGNPNDIVNHYTKLLFSSKDINLSEIQSDVNEKVDSTEYRYGTQEGIIEQIEFFDISGNPSRIITTGKEVIVKMVVIAKKIIEKPIYAMTIKTVKGLEVYGSNSYLQEIDFQSINPDEKVEIVFKQKFNLLPGDYYLSFGFVELKNEDIVPLDRRYDAIEIKVLPKIGDRSFGIANLHTKINIEKV